MAYVPVPKDLTKVKTKVMFNLTKRQLVCFGSGALLGVPLFFLLRGPVGTSTAAMCMDTRNWLVRIRVHTRVRVSSSEVP